MASPYVAAKQMDKVARELARINAHTKDLTPLWRQMGSKIARDNRRAFATRGASVGAPWKPLAASTIRQKLRSGNRSPLRSSGALYASLTGRPMNIEIYEKKAAHYGSSLPTFRWQQWGTFRNGKRHIPPRKIQDLSPATRAEFRRMAVKYVVTGTK
jgi:hypothetical protein